MNSKRILGRYAGYTLAAVAILCLVFLAVLPELVPVVALMAALAWVVQVVAFGVMLDVWAEPNRFLRAWVGGTLVRFAVVAATATVLILTESPVIAPGLLTLVGCLFFFLLLEFPLLNRSTSMLKR